MTQQVRPLDLMTDIKTDMRTLGGSHAAAMVDRPVVEVPDVRTRCSDNLRALLAAPPSDADLDRMDTERACDGFIETVRGVGSCVISWDHDPCRARGPVRENRSGLSRTPVASSHQERSAA